MIRKDYEVGDPLGEWHGTPPGWRKTVLWDLAEYVNGRAFRPADFSPTGLSVIKITELKYGISSDTDLYAGEYHEKHLLEKDDLLFAWSGNPETSLDVFWWHGGNALLNQHIFRVLPRRGVDKQYLYYLLRFLRPTFIRTARDKATSMGHVKVSDLKRLVAFLPAISEQVKIGRFLRRLDDKIELNQRMNETLEAMARAIFKSWLVDFDPVRAKAEGRQPFGMDAETAALFPDSFQDSPLGKIPKGWDVGPILARATLLSGGTPKTEHKDYWNGNILWASAKDVSQCRDAFLIETERSITERGLAESATQLIPKFCTVVVARGATTGRMVLLGRAMAMNQTCYALTTTTNTPFALYCLLRNETDRLVHTAHGSVFDTITTSTFASSRVVLPPQPVVEAFEAQIAPFFESVLANTTESVSLISIRDALLPKFISGELRLTEANGAI